jgi:uncharacterized DUF497 family protein
VKFQWDPRKAIQNRKKHGVSFEEGSTVFGDPLAATIPDPDQSQEEARFVTIGQAARLRLVVVVHVDRDEDVRIISARQATAGKKKKYGEGKSKGR